MLELPFSFWISKNPGEILIFRLLQRNFEFPPIVRKNKSQLAAIFRSAMFLWRHNYVTPWPIVLILVCMNREGPYLPIDTKINFIGGSVRKIQGGGLQQLPWLDVLQKIVLRPLSLHVSEKNSNLPPRGGRVNFQSWEVGGLCNTVILKLDYFENIWSDKHSKLFW